MNRKRVSLNDIATSLGVSKALVSLVLNGKSDLHGISHATTQRVLDKAKELNYQPNHFARGLRIGKSYTIGLIVSDISNAFYSQMARLFEDMAEANGYTLITTSTDEQVDREKKLVQMLRERHVDGLIISSSQDEPAQWDALKAEGFPLVLIDRAFGKSGLPTVVVDNLGGAYQTTKHMLKQGFKRPMALAITPTHISTISQRIIGFRQAVVEQGIEPVVHEVPFSNSHQYVDNLLRELHKGKRMPDCIFTLNNYLATATLDTLRELKVKVPEQVGLACFDDVPYFGFMHPSITAVKQPVDGICKEAFRLLMSQISGGKLNDNHLVTLPVELIIRESTVKGKAI